MSGVRLIHALAIANLLVLLAEALYNVLGGLLTIVP